MKDGQPFTLELSLPEGSEGAEIRYTTDGSEPTRTKVIKAATPRGALIKFKREFGIKGITAERAYTKAEREAISKAAKLTGRKTYFDGRTMCFLDDTLADGAGYTH